MPCFVDTHRRSALSEQKWMKSGVGRGVEGTGEEGLGGEEGGEAAVWM